MDIWAYLNKITFVCIFVLIHRFYVIIRTHSASKLTYTSLQDYHYFIISYLFFIGLYDFRSPCCILGLVEGNSCDAWFVLTRSLNNFNHYFFIIRVFLHNLHCSKLITLNFTYIHFLFCLDVRIGAKCPISVFISFLIIYSKSFGQ